MCNVSKVKHIACYDIVKKKQIWDYNETLAYEIMLTDLYSFLVFRFSGRIYQTCCVYCDQSFQNRFLKKIKKPLKNKKYELNIIRESREDDGTEIKFVFSKTSRSDPYYGNSIGLLETGQ